MKGRVVVQGEVNQMDFVLVMRFDEDLAHKRTILSCLIDNKFVYLCFKNDKKERMKMLMQKNIFSDVVLKFDEESNKC